MLWNPPGRGHLQRQNSPHPALPLQLFPTLPYHHQQRCSDHELTQPLQNPFQDLFRRLFLSSQQPMSLQHQGMALVHQSEKTSRWHQGSSLHSARRMLVIRDRRKERLNIVRTPQWSIMLVGLWATRIFHHPEGLCANVLLTH